MNRINVKIVGWLKFVLTLCVCATLLYGCSPIIISVKPFVLKMVNMSEKDLQLLKNGQSSAPDTLPSNSDGTVGDELPELELPPLETQPKDNPYKTPRNQCGPNGCPLYMA